MDEDKFREEATALLEMARELSMKSGRYFNLTVFPKGTGWVMADGINDINIGY